MEIREIQAIIESLLFAAGEPVELDRLADIVDVDKRSLKDIIKNMMDSYNYERRGIHIIRMEDSYQMCTRSEYHDYVAALAQPRRKMQLSNAAIEVLSIIAYKQPVTRATIENIRGVNCDYIVNRLIERGFVCEVGRLDAPGKPILFGTTKHFLRIFGIQELSELPEFERFGDSEDADEQMELFEENTEQVEFDVSDGGLEDDETDSDFSEKNGAS